MDNLMLLAIVSMTGLGILFAAVLGVADKKLKVQIDPKIEKAVHLLPGTNCGACGSLGCHDFAEHLVLQDEDPAKCRVIAEKERDELFALLGKTITEVQSRFPLVHCAAEFEHKQPICDYKGLQTCRGANLAFGGGMECQYGCMGFGDCTEVCPFDALHMVNGLPKLVPGKCTGCGKCIEACPRNILIMQKKDHDKLFYVACSSYDDTARTRKICAVGCIACGICEKLSPKGFFKVTDGLSEADYGKQNEQEEVKKLQEKCPTKVIRDM